MLKKLALLIGAPIFIVFGGFALFIALDTSSIVPSNPDCGLSLVGPLAQEVPEVIRTQSWRVSSWSGTDPNISNPDVAIRELSPAQIDAPDGMGGGCRLVFKKISNSSVRGADWRVGRDFPIELFRGKTIKTTFMLKAKSKAVLPSGTTYSYDGNDVAGVAVGNIDTKWQTFEIVQDIGEEATTFEIWFRMIFDTPHIIPDSNSIDMLASIEEVIRPVEQMTHQELEIRLAEIIEEVKRPIDQIIEEVKRPIDQMTQQELETHLTAIEQELILMKAQLSSQVKQAPKTTTKGSTHIEEALCHSTLLIANGSTSQQSNINDEWQIYRYDGSSPAPTVDVIKSATGCSLAIKDAPITPRSAIDWRMGKHIDATTIQGKSLTFSAMIGADQPVSFSAGSLYIYDGEKVTSTSFDVISQTKSPYEVSVRIPNDALILQTWIRLVLDDGTITPEEAVLYFDPVIRIAD